MKTSINFKAVKSDSEVQNFRKKTFDYIRKDLTAKTDIGRKKKYQTDYKRLNYTAKKIRKKIAKESNAYS